MRAWVLPDDKADDPILDECTDLDARRGDAERLGIDNRITFHGWIDHTELSEPFAREDVFVNPVVCSAADAPP